MTRNHALISVLNDFQCTSGFDVPFSVEGSFGRENDAYQKKKKDTTIRMLAFY